MYRFFREGLNCDAPSMRKIELTYFAMSVLTVAFLAAGQHPDPRGVLDSFNRRMLERAMAATKSTENFQTVASNYRRRFSEYQTLLRSVLDPSQLSTPDPGIALLVHLYECVTGFSASAQMGILLKGSGIVMQFIADHFEFVRSGLRRSEK